MVIKNIASGSSGNVTFAGTETTRVLIDAGISKKRIVQGLGEEGLDLTDIDAILVTHEHIDHISAIGVIARSYDIPVYATEGTIRGIRDTRSLGNYSDDIFVPVAADRAFSIGDMDILPVRVSHDANEPVCYRLENKGVSFAVVTDLGEYDGYLTDRMKNLNGILLEANHDVRMLEVGPYPYPLKRRILGRYGHLSNESCGRLLSELLNDRMQYIALGHLSKENNTRELARLSAVLEIDSAENDYKSSDFDIQVAWRDRTSPLAELV